jgi:hypothetical protein
MKHAATTRKQACIYTKTKQNISWEPLFVAEGARAKLVTTFLIAYCSVMLLPLYELHRICE